MTPTPTVGRIGPFRRALCRVASFLALAAAVPAQGDGIQAGADRVVTAAGARGGVRLDRVVHDTAADGRLWAIGASWKASFGRDGFTYLPRFGAAAPSTPLLFRVASVRVGGRSLPLAAAALPVRDGDVVTFGRGPVREVYTLGLDRIEQDFVVDTELPGDIEVELAVATDLTCRPVPAGLQFAGEHGVVDYTDAFVRRGADQLPVAMRWDGAAIRLQVAAAQRDTGPVLVDPILSAQSGSALVAPVSTDVAFDENLQRYLLVWEVPYSATDHDVWCEQFDAGGNRIANSAAPIDVTGDSATHPRTADLHAADRFLVAFDLADSFYSGRHMVYSRTREAGSTAVGSYELLSEPNVPGENYAPEVGADPATDASGPHDWLVVWNNVVSATDANVHGRAVVAAGLPKHSWVLVIEDGVDTYNANVQVSRSNGNGQVPHPMWLVVYSRHVGTSVKVYGRTLDLGFVRGNEVPVDDSSYQNLYPQVSSPIVSGDRSVFLVTYERQSPVTARGVLVAFDPAWRMCNYYDLTQQFGLIGQWLRVDSDGVRFAVVCKGTFANELDVQTLAVSNGVFLYRHDGPWWMGNSGSQPEVASCRASGGGIAQYAIAWLQTNGTSVVPRLTRYGGYQAGTALQALATQCHGLDIAYDGLPLLGGAMHFAVPDAVADLPGFALGTPATIPIPICPQCSLGLRLDLPITVTLGSTSYDVQIPPLADLVGQQFAVQGLGVGPWSCFDVLRFSDTVVCTIR